MSQVGPAVLVNVGDTFIEACRISGIVWEGATTAGDQCVLRHRGTNELLWKGRATGSHTYEGMTFGPKGEHCPNGFYLAQIGGSGSVQVFIQQA